jgi:uncharacterized RDD family membrane protein YckC
MPVAATGPYALAEWWRRVVAALIDGAIIVVIALVILAIFGGVFSAGFLGGDTAGTVSLIVGLLLGVLAVVIAALLYAPLVMARTNGQTLGKMAMRIRVIRTSGEPMDFGWSVLREVAVKNLGVAVANSFTFGLAFFADVLWPLWDEENRALHDYVCQTRVVRT